MTVDGGVSFWWRQLGIPTSRHRLPGNVTADVVIVGAGFTGLWTAYYLKRLQPDLRIVMLEARFAGFGASGRNGGWLTNSITGGRGQYVRRHGRDAAIAQQRAMNETVDEVIAVAAAEGIEADIVKGGELNVAYNAAQLSRLRSSIAAEAEWPHTDVVELTESEARDRVNVARVRGAAWHPHCARIHPAKLVTGLARAVERHGVTIYEDTRVTEIVSGHAVTEHGTASAPFIIRATEGFTADVKGLHRRWLPMNSSMVITEPMPTEVWDGIGWSRGEVLGDFAHVYMYAQRTADDRIALGGRGIPYRYGSRLDKDGQTQARTVESLTALLRRFFPGAVDVPIDHAWAGVLGVSRDWSASVGFDPRTGMGWAGAYVGTGVSTTNLAGRTLADLILNRQSPLTVLPWVNHQTRRWELEPIRWLAVTGIYAAYGLADRQESRGRATTAPVARLADLISGR